MDLSARTLILDLLSTLRRGSMPVRALVEAGALFGFASNNVRVSLSKLHAAGRVTRDERGSYRLGETTSTLAEELRGWRRLEREHRLWRGDWVAIHCPRLGRGTERRVRERALNVFGFRELDSGLYVRPDNLQGGVASLRERIDAIVGDTGGGLMVCGLRGLAAADDERARALWDVESLLRSYHVLRETLDESEARLPDLPEEEALAETFLVGGSVVRQLVVDPLLPAPILDLRPRRALVEAMRRYDELGRRRWAPFLAAHGVTTVHASQSWRATHGVVARAVVPVGTR